MSNLKYDDDIYEYRATESALPIKPTPISSASLKTMEALGPRIEKLLEINDKLAAKFHYLPLTSQMVEKYKTDYKFVKALGYSVVSDISKNKDETSRTREDLHSALSETLRIALFPLVAGAAVAAILKIAHTILRVINRSDIYEFYKGRLFMITRTQTGVIKKVYCFYVQEKELFKQSEEKIHFDKVQIVLNKVKG